MELLFAKTRWHYDSYSDFWTLVQLAGYSTCFVDEIDLTSDETYIMAPMNGEWRPIVENHLRDHDNVNARVLLWNLERPGDTSWQEYRDGNQRLIDQGYISGVIVSDRKLAEQTGFTYIPIGIHPDFGYPGGLLGKEYDVIHLMCPNYRRGKWFDSNYNCMPEVYGLSVAANGWGEERHRRMKMSRFMVNIHQDEHPYIEPLRFTLAAAYGIRIVSEASDDFYPYDVCGGIIVSSMQEAWKTIKAYNELEYVRGLQFRDAMLENFGFRHCVERGLS
jgi:hypothetical protein